MPLIMFLLTLAPIPSRAEGPAGPGQDPAAPGTAALPVDVAAVTRHAPMINGRVEGSVWQLLPEDVNINSGAVITSSFLLPGTPRVRLNGYPNFNGVVEGDGNPLPSGYGVILNSGMSLDHIYNRVDPTSIPGVAMPPQSTAKRDVLINTPLDIPADFSDVRDITMNGSIGTLVLPPGTYRNIMVNSPNRIVFGTAGSFDSSVYNISQFTLNARANLEVLSPVVLNLARGLTIDGTAGDVRNPQWMTMNIASGGLTLNGGTSMAGIALVPEGTVIINDRSILTGSVKCDRLIINGTGILRWGGPSDPCSATPPPVISITNPVDGSETSDQWVTVTGTVTAQSQVTVTVNGNPATVSGGEFYMDISLEDGVNTITVIAVDECNHTTDASVTVTKKGPVD